MSVAVKRVIPSLPAIKAEIGHIPQRLKSARFENPRGRLEILRRMVTRLVREERVEFKANRAVECRPYMERLLQLAIHRGASDDYTQEMVNWWVMEPGLRAKLFDQLAPRLRDTPEPYTYMISLPRSRIVYHKDKRIEKSKKMSMNVLEINGNPFPSLRTLEEEREQLFAEYLQRAA